jgi:hypothetical protein
MSTINAEVEARVSKTRREEPVSNPLYTYYSL